MNRMQLVNYARSLTQDERFFEVISMMRTDLAKQAVIAYESGNDPLEPLQRAVALGEIASYLEGLAEDL